MRFTRIAVALAAVTGQGTLVEDTALTWSGGTHGSKWCYKAPPATVILHVFHWEKTNGTTVEATSTAKTHSASLRECGFA